VVTSRLWFGIAIAIAAGHALLAPAPARALDPDKLLSECSVRTWSVSDGLPSAWVRALAQTPDGYLWIGTQAGLVRHGGGDLQPLPAERAFEQAGDVAQLSVGPDGQLWLTPGRGAPVCLRDGVYGHCFPGGQALPPDTRVLTIQPDAGGVWLGTTAGIYRFDGKRLTLVHRPPQWGSTPLTALALQKDHLWIGTGAGLWLAHGPDVSPQTDPAGFGSGPVAALFQAPAGHRWVAAAGRLVRLDGSASVVLGPGEGLRNSNPTSVLEDRHGNVWMATRAGLVRYQAGRGVTTFTRADGLPEDDISTLLEDREGSLWVGTRGGGLAQFTDRTLSTALGPPSLRDRWVYAVAEAPDGALWAGSMLGLTRWKDGQERIYDQADGLPAGAVLTVWPAASGEVWVGGDRGLARWRDGKIDRPLPLQTSVTALYIDAAGTLWIGGPDLLARYDGQRMTRLSLAASETEMPMGEIRGMQHDDRGVLWVSGNGRLYRVEGDHLLRDRAPGTPLFGRVRSLHRDREGTLWLGTFDGLARRRQGAWRAEQPPADLPLTDLFQVLPDDRGHLWIGAARGLFRIDRAALDGGRPGPILSFETTDRRREVAAARSRQPGAWRGGDGRLWFASARGVIGVDPGRVTVNALPPPVRIEQALVDGRPARLRQPNHFAPGSGALEFRYAAITLLEPHKAQHRYRLEGFDAEWVEAGTRRAAYYTNIPPGDYRFRVQGRNADGIWNVAGDSLSLTLAPHFRQTPWFYGLLALTVAGLTLAFYRMRVAQLHGRYAATAAERNRVARELHDNLLQGMSAALIQLKALRKRFLPDGEPAAAREVAGEIEEIQQVLAANVEETRRSIWELRDPGAETTLAAALEHLVGRMRRPGVDLRLVVEGTPAPLPAHVARELLRIAQESIANALDHARPSRVEVTLRQQAGDLSLIVRDDGRGFDPGQAPGTAAGHFGLTGMRERAAGLGAFTLDSQPGGGTRIEVKLSAAPKLQELQEQHASEETTNE
jgi:ligand-binding sensor domain-containing protein/signal transduction histidine kinase